MSLASPVYRTLLVQDADEQRQMMRLLLQSDGRFHVVGEATNGAQALRLAELYQPDLVLLDISMPVMEGLEALPRIRTVAPETRLVVLSTMETERLAPRALRDASAFVKKTLPFAQLVDELSQVVTQAESAPVRENLLDTAPPLEPAPRSPDVLVHAAISAITSDLDPLQALSSCARTLQQWVPFCLLSLAVIEGDRYRRVVSVSKRPIPAFSRGGTVPLEGNPIKEVVEERVRKVVHDTSVGLYPFDANMASVGVGSYVVFPLIDDTGVFATFNVAFERPHMITEEYLELLAPVAVAVVPGVKNILRFEQQQNALRRLQDLNRVRNDFVAMVAHDLRSPVTVIANYSEQLLARWESLSEATRREMLAAISRTARGLTSSVEEIFQVALIETGEFNYELQPFDLAAMVRDTVALYQRQDERLNVSVPSGLPLAHGDEHRHRQVLTNLISNALKFSPPDARVRVEVASTGAELRVAVSDQGEGISLEDQERLFQKFSRLRTGGKRARGTGLGLYICKSMVESQGGRIWVESVVGKGSTFFFTVPVVTPHNH